MVIDVNGIAVMFIPLRLLSPDHFLQGNSPDPHTAGRWLYAHQRGLDGSGLTALAALRASQRHQIFHRGALPGLDLGWFQPGGQRGG